MISIKGRVAGMDTVSIPAYVDLLQGSDDSYIGYRIYCTKHTIETLSLGDSAKLQIYQLIREESNTLYGFIYEAHKQSFELLLTAKGIGGNTALLILGQVDTPKELYKAIVDENIGFFTKFKGVGKTTATSLINSLKNKALKLI